MSIRIAIADDQALVRAGFRKLLESEPDLLVVGSRGRGGVEVSVNDKPVGGTGRLLDSGVMHRDGIRGYWEERRVAFDATRLQAGRNVIQLLNTGRTWTDGVLYDYLRLELDELAPAKKD